MNEKTDFLAVVKEFLESYSKPQEMGIEKLSPEEYKFLPYTNFFLERHSLISKKIEKQVRKK